MTATRRNWFISLLSVFFGLRQALTPRIWIYNTRALGSTESWPEPATTTRVIAKIRNRFVRPTFEIVEE